jgi:hypothetical protein
MIPSASIHSQTFEMGTVNEIAKAGTVSNLPVLNFTNLRDEVSLSPSGDNVFFRLIAQ